MRAEVDVAKIAELMRELGRRARGPGRIYLTGGASALLYGWRTSTVDIDIKLDPEPDGVFQAIASLKNELRLSIELAAPDQFLPQLTDWRQRSIFIARHGQVQFFHYDFRAQALAKLTRGHERDIDDVRSMLERDLVAVESLRSAFEQIRPDLVRYPAVDAHALEQRVYSRLSDMETDDG